MVGCTGSGNLDSLKWSIEPASLGTSFSIVIVPVRDVAGCRMIKLSPGYDLVTNKDIVFTMKVSDQSGEGVRSRRCLSAVYNVLYSG